MSDSSTIHRRKFLHGLGASVALPTLECMLPGSASAAAAKKGERATRMAFIYTPNGAIMDKWVPKGEGAKWELSPTLSALKNVKDDIQVITGLEHDKANNNGDGGGDHARATATFLTGVQARKNGRRGHPTRRLGRPGRSGAGRLQDQARLAPARLRSGPESGPLRFRILLRLPVQFFLEERHPPAGAGDRSADRLRESSSAARRAAGKAPRAGPAGCATRKASSIS